MAGETNSDTVIDASWVVTVDQHNTVHKDHALVIRAGRIHDLLPSEAALNKYPDSEIINRRDHILLPGLINAHTHMAMNLLRGIADDLPLMTWLQNHIWPTEAQWVNEQFVREGTEAAIAESLLGGVTCFNDMYFFPDQVADIAQQAGIRATIGMIVLDFPSAWADNADSYIERGLALHDQLRTNSLLNTAFAPHAPYSVSPEPLRRIATLSAELEVPVHMHLHETEQEVLDYIRQHGRRPLSGIDGAGLLNDQLLAVHMTQLTDYEIDRCATVGLSVLHCPESNMKLASGGCPISELLAAGVNVALGTDGAASNNDLDMFGEMRTAALLAKHQQQDAAAIPASTALRMATINGAKALGIEQQTGSLEIGKAADCITVNCNNLQMSPMYSPESHLVYTTDRTQVNDVWVGGRALVRERKLTTLDEKAINSRLSKWADRISSQSAS